LGEEEVLRQIAANAGCGGLIGAFSLHI